jgi:hypothetical protein
MKSLIAEGVMYWNTHDSIYNFQSEYGLDFDGWRIRFDRVNAQYYLECLEDGSNRKMTMKEYDSLVNE